MDGSSRRGAAGDCPVLSQELSQSELEAELCEVLPQRTLMRRHHHRLVRHHRMGAFARFGSFGSAVNSNRTTQINFNPQIVVGTGGSGGINVSSFNVNNNSNVQTAIPINFGI